MTRARPTWMVDTRNVARAAALLQGASSLRPTLGFILGSGFQKVTARVAVESVIDYARLPGFPRPGVGGHAGKVVLGRLGGQAVVLLSGRAHYYEGTDLDVVTRPVRTLAALGVRDLVVTNAAGGMRRGFRPGDLMLLTDHINLMGVNPLRGPVWPGLERFVDLTRAYDEGLTALVRRAARKERIRLREGVYVAVAGPSYETPAEIRAFRALGGDAVGMSTVPEVIVARQHGMRVAGLSGITNLAAARGNPLLSHADVLAAGAAMTSVATALLARVASMYAGKD